MNATVRYEALNNLGYPCTASISGELLDEHPILAVIEHSHGTTKVPWTNVIDIYESKDRA